MNENTSMMRSLQRETRKREKEIVRLLGQFVRCESPSHHKAAVDRFGRMVASEWRRRGAKVRVLRQTKRGNHVRAELWLGAGRPTGQILILGHLDTVYPLGTLAKMPFRVRGGRAFGNI
jgi:glutamate carboxypeptidase